VTTGANKATRALALRTALRVGSSLAFGLCVAAASACHDSNATSASASASTSPGAGTEGTAAVADVVLPGVDISPMTPRERHEWSALATELSSPCPNVPVSVAQCVLEKRPCGMCLQSAKWLAQVVRDGVSQDQVERAYKARFDPSAVKVIPIDGSPTKGPDNAPVTVFEFADFECPHCRDAVPKIDAVLAAHPNQVRLIYKTYTLPFHVHGEPAAKAAFAAGNQGKFWEMEHLLFERQQNLEMSDLEHYAQMLKLDLPKWKSDMDSPEVAARIAHDHELGESLKLQGTPTIYINGREFESESDETLEAHVAGELGLLGESVGGAKATDAGAGPAVGSARADAGAKGH
jgi:protein-disulfide isomerase